MATLNNTTKGTSIWIDALPVERAVALPRLERAEIDPVFKEVMTFNFGQLSLPIETQVEVSRLPRTMDALVLLPKAEYREKVRKETAFDYFRVHNQLEYKGKEDRLTRNGYHLIIGRSHLYLGEKKISTSEMTVTIISSRKPRQVLYHSTADVRWEEVGFGHYKSTDLLPVHLFVCDELEMVPKNYPLLLFAASKEKFRQFVEKIVSEDNTIYIYYASRVEPEITKEVLKMSGKQSLYEKNLRRIAESMGEDLIPFLSEEVLKRLPPEKRVRSLTAKDIVRSLSPETKEELLQLLTKQSGKQN
jgi:hypothetical protein